MSSLLREARRRLRAARWTRAVWESCRQMRMKRPADRVAMITGITSPPSPCTGCICGDRHHQWQAPTVTRVAPSLRMRLSRRMR